MSDLPPPPPSSPSPSEGWQQPPPPGGAQPQQAPPGGWPQQPPQQIIVKQNSGCLKIGLIVAAVLAVFAIGIVGCLALAGNEVSKQIDKSMGTADPSDYKITDLKCTNDEMLGLTATGKIQNTSNKAQGFALTIRWTTDAGDLITEDPEFTDTIDVGQSQIWKSSSLKDAPAGSSPTCKVSKVEYTIFDNEGD